MTRKTCDPDSNSIIDNSPKALDNFRSRAAIQSTIGACTTPSSSINSSVTEAIQDLAARDCCNINETLKAINSKLILGQQPMANSLAVVIASNQSPLPVSVTFPSSLAVTQSGTWNINNISGTISLPTGAATEATLSALNVKFNSLGQKAMVTSAPVVIASDQSAIPISGTVTATVPNPLPVSQSGTWNINNISGTVSLPTGAATETTLSSLNAKFNSLGQKIMTGSVPVVIASDQSTIPISGTVTATIPNPLPVTQSGTWNITNISGTISLPTGAATEATLSTLNAKFGAIGQQLMAASAAVVIASNQSAIPVSQSGTWNIGTVTTLTSITNPVAVTQSGTWNINNISGTISLPTGASTETTLAALNAKFGSLGQKAMTGSAPVVIASDQSAVPVTASQATASSLNAQVVGELAAGASDTGNPVAIGGKAQTTPTAVTAGQRVKALFDLIGRIVTHPWATRDQWSSSAPTAFTTSTVAAIVAADATYKNDLMAVTIVNSSATDTEIIIYDDDGTTERWHLYAKANDMRGQTLPGPLKQTAVNKTWKAKTVTGVSTVYITPFYVKNL